VARDELRVKEQVGNAREVHEGHEIDLGGPAVELEGDLIGIAAHESLCTHIVKVVQVISIMASEIRRRRRENRERRDRGDRGEEG